MNGQKARFSFKLYVHLFAAGLVFYAVLTSAQQNIPPSDNISFRLQGGCDFYQYSGPELGLQPDFTAFWNAHSICGGRDFGNITASVDTQIKRISWQWSMGGSASASYQMVPCPTGYVLQNNLCTLVGADPEKRPDQCAKGGNPIYFGAGSKEQEEIDMEQSGLFPLSYKRTYRSDQKRSGTLGIGWKDNLSERKIVLYSGGGITTAVVYRPDSYLIRFNGSANQWINGSATAERLERNTDGSWIFRTQGNLVENYVADGKLHSIVHPSGLSHTFQYDASDRLESVLDNFGNSIAFQYNAYNLIKKVTDFSQQEYRFEYVGLRLTRVIYPQENTRTYLYENASLPFALTGIINEEGTRYATWIYDTSGRAISSSHHASTEAVSFTYTSATSIVETGPLGKQTTYQLELINGVRRVKQVTGHASANCAAANKSYAYYANGTLQSKTDWEGNVTTYVRDSFGRETSRTEAFGSPQARTIITEYHPTLNLPTRIEEPGRVEVMTYDASGRLLTQNIQSTNIP